MERGRMLAVLVDATQVCLLRWLVNRDRFACFVSCPLG